MEHFIGFNGCKTVENIIKRSYNEHIYNLAILVVIVILKWKDKKKLTRQNIDKRNFQRDCKRNILRKTKGKSLLSSSIVVIPSNFSIVNNTEETIKCFNNLLTIVSRHKDGMGYIDSGQIENLDAGALMYLIAIITEANKQNYCFNGNHPKTKIAKEMYKKYGFYNYVSTTTKIQNIDDGNTLQIIEMSDVNPAVANKICDFAENHGCFSNDPLLRRQMYVTLVELMGNVVQHAYTDTTISNKWLSFSEFKNEAVNFLFFDIGRGIPETVNTNFLEEAKNLILSPDRRECDLIQSSFEGAFRTQTQEKHRGQGLPQIRKFLQSPNVAASFVFSGKGYYSVSMKNEAHDFKEKLHGTLFGWTIRGV